MRVTSSFFHLLEFITNNNEAKGTQSTDFSIELILECAIYSRIHTIHMSVFPSKIQSQNIDREKHMFACMLAIHFHWTLVKTTISFAFIFLVFVSKIELAWTKQDLFFNSKFRRSHVNESGGITNVLLNLINYFESLTDHWMLIMLYLFRTFLQTETGKSK